MNNSTDSNLQDRYDILYLKYIRLTIDNHHLRHQVKELTELACALSDESYPLPSFLKKAFDPE